MNVSIALESQWIDEAGTSHSQTVANLDIPLRGVKLRGPVQDVSTIPFEASSTPSAWFAPIPRTITTNTSANAQRPLAKEGVEPAEASKPSKFGNGTFVVKVKVTEYDDFGKRVKKLAEYVESNREGLVGKVKTYLGPQSGAK